MPEFMVTQRRRGAKKDKEGKRRKANGLVRGLKIMKQELFFAPLRLCVWFYVLHCFQKKTKTTTSTTKILLKPVIGRLCEKGVPKNDD